jgi:HlyD family secretion protein
MELKQIIRLIGLGVLLLSCNNGDISDAYGQFEADKTTISSETSGILKSFEVKEGMKLETGQKVGQVDTTQLSLRKEELMASVRSIRTNIDKLTAQADVYKEQLKTAEQDLDRLISLKQNNAATQQQIDHAKGQVNVLQKQIASVEVQKQSVYAELEAMRTRISQVEDQLQKAQIINPVEGMVLSSFAEPNELVSAGKPLYEIANLEEMELRVYISGAQLPNITLGQNVEVLIDKDAAVNEALKGTVSWIASEAEFTPRMIQTKEERVTQVYAVKVRVPNPDGKLKIGMPGEVNF